MSGGKIDLTPSGTMLIPEMYRNRVVERDLDGKEIRVINIDSPVIALSLPNGHIVITSNTENRFSGKTAGRWAAGAKKLR